MATSPGDEAWHTGGSVSLLQLLQMHHPQDVVEESLYNSMDISS
jgi:hypothetical protein